MASLSVRTPVTVTSRQGDNISGMLES